MADFEAFMRRVMQRPMPTGSMDKIRTLARELAEGAADEIWHVYFYCNIEKMQGIKANESFLIPSKHHTELRRYLSDRWHYDYPSFVLLSVHNYLKEDRLDEDTLEGYRITKESFELIKNTEPSTSFISYRRKKSSAFALLVRARLKEYGLDAFLDMSIQAGDNWHAYIQERIESHDFFIVLLNHETLDSDVVRDEIQWAIDAKKIILPIAHPEFEYAKYREKKVEEGNFNLTPEMDAMLTNTHTIRVLEESTLAYNNAIVELLNRFGITP